MGESLRGALEAGIIFSPPKRSQGGEDAHKAPAEKPMKKLLLKL
jgi:hypothetical protein